MIKQDDRFVEFPAEVAVPVYGGTSTAGWIKYPNGYIMQWGTYSTTQDAPESFTFPTAFSTRDAAVVVNRLDDDSGHEFNVTSVSATGFIVDRNGDIDGTYQFRMLAMGV